MRERRGDAGGRRGGDVTMCADRRTSSHAVLGNRPATGAIRCSVLPGEDRNCPIQSLRNPVCSKSRPERCTFRGNSGIFQGPGVPGRDSRTRYISTRGSVVPLCDHSPLFLGSGRMVRALKSLNTHRHCLAAAKAEGCHARCLPTVPEGVKEGRQDAGA